ncbi:peptidylprolyl isomerase [Ectothiorhodospiraceae bacterium WFHF3C12]|nr:peptidylprolyl isomerase [Ectothiorhodospiraceae bacterium WFHF3C12]
MSNRYPRTRRTTRTLVHGLVAILGLALCAPGVVAAAQTLDRIVAVVNEDVVLASELEQELREVRAQLDARGVPTPSAERLRQQVLERLVMQRIQLNEADRAGISVDDATLNAAVQRVARNNDMSLSELRDAMAGQGMDFADFRDRLRRDIKINRLQQQALSRRVNVSSQEIEDQLEQQQRAGSGYEYRLRHILVSIPEAASAKEVEAAREEARTIYENLTAGESDFSAVAAARSDSQTALEGGDLGWRSNAELPTLFAERVPGMSVGEVSRPIRNPSGFHIIQLADRRASERHMVEQTRARHILIKPNAVVTAADARQRLESLRRRIQAGESFEELARANSDDGGSASQGGELGWVNPGTMVPRFEQTMDRLDEGEISQPFETRYGWHIVQVLERRRHDSTDDVQRNRAANEIRQRKEEEAREQWLRRLREEAYVDYRLEE